MGKVRRARGADKAFMTLNLIARGELSDGVVAAGSDFAKRLASANSVVVGSYISENGYVAQDNDRVIGSCGRRPGCANNGVGAGRRRWRWAWRRRWGPPRRGWPLCSPPPCAPRTPVSPTPPSHLTR